MIEAMHIPDTDVLKEYLEQYTQAKKRSERLIQRLEQLQFEMDNPIRGINYDPISAPSGQISEGSAAYAYRKEELEQRIYAQHAQVEVILLKVMDILDFLDPASPERDAFEMHYIDGLTWEAVADEIPCARSQVFNLLNSGLAKLLTFAKVRRIIDKFRKERGYV